MQRLQEMTANNERLQTEVRSQASGSADLQLLACLHQTASLP